MSTRRSSSIMVRAACGPFMPNLNPRLREYRFALLSHARPAEPCSPGFPSGTPSSG